jgi:hypothetical protein
MIITILQLVLDISMYKLLSLLAILLEIQYLSPIIQQQQIHDFQNDQLLQNWGKRILGLPVEQIQELFTHRILMLLYINIQADR